MAYANASRADGATLRDRFAVLRTDLSERLARRRLYRTTLDELTRLDDRDLADLGIHRSQLKSIAHESAYGRS
ncbi:DUF1127 domain-containing protein [Wenxinia marina]|uniref:YjiS-like domain-containing protein n=1 Tax=Wenxinia marina DSM 24838 TaxID=1123501 RepID=A0A0D0PEA9_9RHOB|nr:DUF1127 domain-containing protein [Wenxinia marina]KIQ69721.1 hypothetical protein Wenmar_02085 [Wenxinia marina DSM 24838]GGL60686.1 hypothetical protein GCM10011392_13920 [Wenxinia marina]